MPETIGQGACPDATPSWMLALTAHRDAFMRRMLDVVSLPIGRVSRATVFEAIDDLGETRVLPTSADIQQAIRYFLAVDDTEAGVRKALGGLVLQVHGVVEPVPGGDLLQRLANFGGAHGT